MGPIRVIADDAVSVKGRRVGLTYYDPGEQRYLREWYRVPPPRFRARLTPSIGKDSALITANVSYRGVGVQGMLLQYFERGPAHGPYLHYHLGVSYTFTL